ncbi:hypothetical protein [Chitinophaga alhagiae]|uniref:hypothetical protein n=1 Tax=Chitinophaga alhagiae TaxID=2203219 RepID=UPI000E5C18F0|nr:hypothetical protein [Chitinophaga alhagiae]
MQREDFYTLMQAIAKYYPVGIDIDPKSYPGYDYWCKAAEGKINRIIAGDRTPWRGFLSILQTVMQFTGDDPDCSFWQFPSLSFRLELQKVEDEYYSRVQTFCFDISLLTEVYTMFVEDSISTKFVNGGIAGKHPAFYIVSTQTKESDIFQRYSKAVSDNIGEFFPNHKFIGHYGVFEREVASCVPYHINHFPGAQYSIYDFLFSSAYTSLRHKLNIEL